MTTSKERDICSVKDRLMQKYWSSLDRQDNQSPDIATLGQQKYWLTIESGLGSIESIAYSDVLRRLKSHVDEGQHIELA